MLSGSVISKQYRLIAVATADDAYLLGYSLISNAFRVFNTKRQQTEETYHITFDESPEAIKFSKPSVDNINIAESERYPPNEYLYRYEPSQRFINDHLFQNDGILNDDPSEHSNHTNNEQIIDNLPNTKDIKISEHLSSLNAEDTSAQNTIQSHVPHLTYFHQWSLDPLLKTDGLNKQH
ncbi:hypothetical protein Tco_1173526 [Tanacetum coccineum]